MRRWAHERERGDGPRFVNLQVGDEVLTFEVMPPTHAVRVDMDGRAMLSDDMREALTKRNDYLAAVQRGEDVSGMDPGDDAAWLAALEATDAIAGWLILNMWADPVWELQTETRWREGAYANHDAPQFAAGRDVYDELFRWDVDPADIGALYRLLKQYQGAGKNGRAPTRRVSEIVPFSGAEQRPATTP